MKASERNVTGVLLAGGRSRRFGSDKARAVPPGSDKTLLETLLAVISAVTPNPFVIADSKDRYGDLGLATVADIVPGKGPLGGLHAALTAADAPAVLVLTCDMPCVTADMLKTLLETHRDADSEITVCRHAGRIEPFPGIYRKEILPLVTRNLNEGNLDMRGLIANARHVRAIDSAFPEALFLNVNTAEDWRRFVPLHAPVAATVRRLQ